MLAHLAIRDFAIIEKLEVDFDDGFVVVTGETGAGKSILINALHLVLGGRAADDMIRSEADGAEVEAVFDLPADAAVRDRLAALDLADGDQMIIRRSIARRGRNRVFVNDRQVNLATLIELASEQVNGAELAGDPDGPFGADQLRRELKLTPWQRINYVLGYLHERHPSGCDLPAEPLPNPLEWSSLATVVTWFAQQAPVYLQTPENEARINGLRQYGMRLLDAWVQQVDCISGAGTGINDPVSRGLADYRQALDELASDLRDAPERHTTRARGGRDGPRLDGDGRQGLWQARCGRARRPHEPGPPRWP